MHLHVELELDFTRRRHWGSRDDELIIAHHSTRFQGCAALLLLMLEAATRTSFHHQPEAQHPNFPLSVSWQADLRDTPRPYTRSRPTCNLSDQILELGIESRRGLKQRRIFAGHHQRRWQVIDDRHALAILVLR